MSDEHEWIEVMDDMAGGPMVYKSEADEAIATLTAERDALVAAIGVALPLLDRVPGDEYTLDEHDDIRIMKEMHLAAQLKEQDDE